MRRRTLTHNPKVQQNLEHGQRVHARAKVIHYNTRSFGELLKTAHRRRLHNVEYTKKYKAREQRLPHDGTRDERHELPRHFVNYDMRRIFLAATTRLQRRGRNPDGHYNDDK